MFLAAHNYLLYQKCNKNVFNSLCNDLCLMIFVFVIYFDLWINVDFLTW